MFEDNKDFENQQETSADEITNTQNDKPLIEDLQEQDNQESDFESTDYIAESSEYEEVIEPETKTKKRSGLQVFTAVMLCIFTVSFIAFGGMLAYYLIPGQNNEQVKNDQIDSNENDITTDNNSFATLGSPDASALTIPQIAQKCSPSAVGIVTEVETTYNYGFFSQQGKATSMGSGFILNSDGYVITNHHVIEGAQNITVIMNDSQNTEVEATLIGSDSISDIAVLKLNNTENISIIPVELGDSDKLVVGESVVAIGCPAGIEFIGTVTDGIVSAINRNVEITDSYGKVQKTMTLIQTNATINKGNSGGPLINSKGQVVGINTLKLTSEYEGIGFSIPINGAMSIINQLVEHGKVVERTQNDFAYGQGVIGISGSAISKDEADYYGIPQGVLVYQIDKNSSAAKAGLRRGDIITAYNGAAVKTVDDINNLKSKNRAGEKVTITVYRDAENSDQADTFDISFTLDPQN